MSDAVDLSKLYEAILTGDAKTSVEVTEAALAAGEDPQKLVMEHMVSAMDEVGRRFECNQYFVPELLIAARAMKSSLDIIRPLLAERGIEPVGRVVVGTVKGDLHDIGKGLVASMLEGGGFEVIDLGVDVSAEKFVEEAEANNAHIFALSALLTTTMTAMKTVIEKLTEAGVREKHKVIIGGAPVTQEFADSIAADGYSPSAAGAVNLAREMTGAGS